MHVPPVILTMTLVHGTNLRILMHPCHCKVGMNRRHSMTGQYTPRMTSGQARANKPDTRSWRLSLRTHSLKETSCHHVHCHSILYINILIIYFSIKNITYQPVRKFHSHISKGI